MKNHYFIKIIALIRSILHDAQLLSKNFSCLAQKNTSQPELRGSFLYTYFINLAKLIHKIRAAIRHISRFVNYRDADILMLVYFVILES